MEYYQVPVYRLKIKKINQQKCFVNKGKLDTIFVNKNKMSEVITDQVLTTANTLQPAEFYQENQELLYIRERDLQEENMFIVKDEAKVGVKGIADYFLAFKTSRFKRWYDANITTEEKIKQLIKK